MKASGENEPKRHFFKSNKSKYPMYPLHEEKIRWDDYGEIIRPEDWMDTSMATNTDPNDDPNAPGFNGKFFFTFFLTKLFFYSYLNISFLQLFPIIIIEGTAAAS